MGLCWAILLCCGVNRTAAASTAAPTPPVRLLLTHPTAAVLETYVTLVRLGILKIPSVELVGIYHAAETEDYAAAQRWIEGQKLSWVRLEKISCSLKKADLFRAQACTPQFKRLFQESNGLIVNGGADMPPELYGEQTLLTTQIETPARHYFELSLLFHLVGGRTVTAWTPLLSQRPNYPILAICLGMQSLNVAAGGTLVQEIATQIYGLKTLEEEEAQPLAAKHRDAAVLLHPQPSLVPGVLHPILLTTEAPQQAPWSAARGSVQVLSVHHQAVGQLGAGLQVVATSLDGKVIEAVVHQLFAHVVGVQFHPEKLWLWQPQSARLAPATLPALPSPAQNHQAHTQPRLTSDVYRLLRADARSEQFHQQLWLWFAEQLIAQNSASSR